MCSNCGWINQDLTLKDRKWTCPSCGEKYDRDFSSRIESDTKQKQVKEMLLCESMKPETH